MNPPHHEEDYEADTRAWEFDEETIDVTVASHQTEHGGQLSRPDRNGNAVRTNTFGSGSSMGNRSRVERASAVHPSNMDSNLKDKNFGTKKGFLAKNGKFRLANSAKDGSAQAGHQVHQGPIRQRNAQAAPSALAYGGMGWSTDSRSRAPHVFDSSNYGYSKAFALDSSKNGQFSSRHSTRGRMHPSRTSTRGRMYPSSASLDGQFSGRHSTGGRMHSSSASRVPTNAGRIRQPGASRLPVDVGRTQQPRADIKASHADLRKGLERGTHHIQRLSTYGLTNRREWDSATKRNFARSTGPINARITKTKEETKKQSADRDRYLTQPEAGEKFEIELYFQVDDMSIELLTEDDQALNEIRIGFGVFITYDLALECLRIQANQQRDPDHVIAAIRNTLKRLGTNTSGSASKFLIYPPSPEDYRPDVIAVSLQPFRVAMRGQAITQPELGSYAEWGQKQVIRHDDQLLEKLREKMEDLRFHKEQWIKMCVKYGTLELTNYHARLNAEGMPFKEFFSMLESNRCRGILKECLGDAAFARFFIETILEVGDDVFSAPMYSSADGLEDVKQDHMVTIFVRNGTGDSWRIQMKLETNGSRGTYSSSPAVIFLGAKDMKRFSCTTIAMAQEVDTSIEVVANTVVQPDKAMESLIKRVQSAPIIAKPDRNGDEIARIYLGLKESFKPGEPHETLDGGLIVKSVVLRTSKTFAIVNSSYEVTVNADRKWATHKTNVEPTSTECSVQLSNPRWADLLQEMSNGQHTWDAELAVFFADVDPGAANGYPFFMDKVRYVRDLLERAIAASANAKERRP